MGAPGKLGPGLQAPVLEAWASEGLCSKACGASRSHLHTSVGEPLSSGFPKFTFSFSFIRDLWNGEGRVTPNSIFSVGIYLVNLSSTTF